MNRLQKTLLAFLTCVASTLFAQTKNDLLTQKGVSVQMALTEHATEMPDAGLPEACVVTVTADGKFYVGSDPVSLRINPSSAAKSCLYEQRKKNPGTRLRRLYIKVDARVPVVYLDIVLSAATPSDLDSAIGLKIDSVGLLTSQVSPAPASTPIPPKGLEVRPFLSWNPQWMVQVLKSEQSTPKIKFNGEDIALAALPDKLKPQLETRSDSVVIAADSDLPFEKLATVIDLCRSMGANVYIALPHNQ
jgi:biopolymer transport protein ExbD